MTNESILISEVIPASPQRIFSAWMDSAQHSAFTGDEATVVPEVGGELRAAGGYIQGRTLELNEGSRIVQSWRTTEFPPESPDSRVEITLEPTLGGTLVTLLHTDIPVGQGDRYRQGWNEYYLSRMKAYFSDGDQPSSDLAGMRGQIPAARDTQDADDDTDEVELELGADGDEGDTALDASIVESDVITSVGERPAEERPARSAPGRAKSATKLKAAPRPAVKPRKLAAGSARAPVARSSSSRPSSSRPSGRASAAAVKSAKALLTKARSAVSAGAARAKKPAGKKLPRAAARRPGKASGKAGRTASKRAGQVKKTASARRAPRPGKAQLIARGRAKAKAKATAKSRPGSVKAKARSKPARGKVKGRTAKRPKAPPSPRARR